MLSDKLLSELHQLSDAEKLRIVQLLVNELAADNTSNELIAGATYEISSPDDSFEAAHQLLIMLDEYKRTHGL
jgi:hypothetical protein